MQTKRTKRKSFTTFSFFLPIKVIVYYTHVVSRERLYCVFILHGICKIWLHIDATGYSSSQPLIR